RGKKGAVGGSPGGGAARPPAGHPHRPVRAGAHQRLPAGEAEFVDPQRRGHADEVGDLLEGEQFAPVEEHHLLRHAVDAAEVAAVRHADAQVVVSAAEGVDERVHAPPSAAPGWTHSVDPSAQFSFFQIGTTSFSRSMAWRHASNACARCGELTATAKLTSPTSWRPSRGMRACSLTDQLVGALASFVAMRYSWL